MNKLNLRLYLVFCSSIIVYLYGSTTCWAFPMWSPTYLFGINYASTNEYSPSTNIRYRIQNWFSYGDDDQINFKLWTYQQGQISNFNMHLFSLSELPTQHPTRGLLPLLLPLMWNIRGARFSMEQTDSKAHVYPCPPTRALSVKVTPVFAGSGQRSKPQPKSSFASQYLLFFFSFYFPSTSSSPLLHRPTRFRDNSLAVRYNQNESQPSILRFPTRARATINPKPAFALIMLRSKHFCWDPRAWPAELVSMWLML